MVKSVPSQMQTDLDNGATHHCLCWQVTRTDGSSYGFTDHDRPLTFNSVTFAADTGMNGTSIESSSGLSVDNMDVMGVLNSLSIDEQDIAAGLYDNAQIIAYRVDWSDVNLRVVLLQGSIGNISRGSMAFNAEVRGLAHELNQKVGRLYEPICNADLGDSKCGINLSGTSPDGFNYTVSSVVTAASARNSFNADTAAMGAVPDGWFNRGKLTWTSGANLGQEIEVKVHIQQDTTFNQVLLWEPMPYTIGIGDGFTVTAGCNKSPDSCFNKFNNMLNFRGFNLIPGNDVILRSAITGEDNTGGSIFS